MTEGEVRTTERSVAGRSHADARPRHLGGPGGSDDGSPPSRRTRRARFQRANAGIAFTSSAAVLVGVGIYLVSTADRPNRPVIWGLLLVANVAGAIAVTVARRWRPTRLLMHAWTVTVILTVVGGVAADGGLASPLAAVLFVPLGVTAMALRPRAMTGHGALAIGGLAVAGYATDTLAIGLLAIWTMCLFSVVLVGLGVAHNTRRLTREIEAANDELRELSRRDPMTGSLNHRSFHEEVERELARAARADSSATLVLLDIDRFKEVNDTYGHPVGDAVLIAVTEALNASTRAGDVVARTGGEEFAVLLPSTAVEPAKAIAERIRSAIAHAGSPVAVTVSAGLASFPVHGRTSTRLIQLADQAMYQAKRDGRDRLRMAHES